MSRVIFIFYPILLLLFSIFSYVFIDPNLVYLKFIYTGFAFDNKLTATVLYSIFLIVFFVFYVFILVLTKKNKLTLNNLKILVAIMLGILFLSYPAMLSYDIFNYITTAKVSFFYKENPYLIMPTEFIGDPFLEFTRAANKTALYGPFWISLTGIPYLFGFNNFLLILFNFKLMVAAFYLGLIFLIWKFTKNLYSIAFFAFNPLVIIETLAGSHNDAVMMFLALFSFFLLKKNKIWQGFIFLVLSILIKYSTIFLIPVFLYVVFKKIKKINVNWGKVFYVSSLSMLLIFSLSPFREEIYSWYAIWFLSFTALIPQNKIMQFFSITISLSLLLRYIPYMLTADYFGSTPLFKIILTFVPLALLFLYFLVKEKLWLKILYR